MDTLDKNELNDQDEVLKELFKRSVVGPPPDLRDKVMKSISTREEVFLYEPVISKRVWVAVGIVLAGLLVWVMIGGSSDSFSWMHLDGLGFVNWPLSGDLFQDWSFRLMEIPIIYTVALGAFMLFGICYVVYFGVFIDWLNGRNL